MAEIAVSVAISLIENVVGFLSHEINHTFGNIDGIKTSLTTMQAYLLDANRVEREDNRYVMKDLIKRIQNLANETEDVIDEFMLHAPRRNFDNQLLQKMYLVGHYSKRWIPLHRIQSKMEDIRESIKELEASEQFRIFLQRYAFGREGYENGRNHHLLPLTPGDDEILGREETKGKLVDQVINNMEMIRTLSVVGPSGSGKTSLVHNVFRSKRIQGQFECCAWINARSQSLVASFRMGRDEKEISLSELQKTIRRKKYLVVVDDIQSAQQWKDIAHALPNERNDSKIIITTINYQVAVACAGSADHIHQLDGLPWKDSWNLFCLKAFRESNGKCPEELVDIAQKIVKRCEGSPVAIISVGSVLSRKSSLPVEWVKVHDNLCSSNATITNMINRNYKDLGSNLKCCFLYFSIFPEDFSVSRARLIRLWVAEGFVKKTGTKTLEETGEEYLNELIDRNLIQACRRGTDGRVRSCRILNLVREFVIMESSRENFALVLTDASDVNTCEKIRRLSIHNYQLQKIRRKTNLNHVRTISAFGFNNDASSEVKVATEECKFLRVLDLRNGPMKEFPRSIADWPLLRYLCLRGTDVKEVPKSINELHYLEYLDLKYTNVVVLPKDVCKLQNLRHLLVSRDTEKNSIIFNNTVGANVEGNIGGMLNLQNLTLIKAKCKKFLVELGNLEQLEKLGLIELGNGDGIHLCESIKKMPRLSVLNLTSTSENEFLDLDYMENISSNLQRLYLKGRLHALPKWINPSLSNVTRIHLIWSLLEETPLEALQSLPNLVELQMIEAYLGERLVFNDWSFQKLKTLHIECFHCLNALTFKEAMPRLQKLTISNCMNLHTLPDMRFLRSLEELILYDMPAEFTRRLKKGTPDRKMINHIQIIHSFTTDDNGSLHTSNYS